MTGNGNPSPKDGRSRPVAVVTGTGGLGFELSRRLAGLGARVIMAGRNEAEGQRAVAAISAQLPMSSIRFLRLDLADLSSVREFGRRMATLSPRVDILVNNAGVVLVPERTTTRDGFELQFGTNHLGHFALTSHLLPLLQASESARIVHVGSLAHRFVTFDFDDPNAERSYRAFTAYARSKLATLMFSRELQKRSDAAGWALHSIAAHPGIARTGATEVKGPVGRLSSIILSPLRAFLLTPPERAVLPLLFAATSTDARPGSYYGPGRSSGGTAPARASAQARDNDAACRLWELSERLIGKALR